MCKKLVKPLENQQTQPGTNPGTTRERRSGTNPGTTREQPGSGDRSYVQKACKTLENQQTQPGNNPGAEIGGLFISISPYFLLEKKSRRSFFFILLSRRAFLFFFCFFFVFFFFFLSRGYLEDTKRLHAKSKTLTLWIKGPMTSSNGSKSLWFCLFHSSGRRTAFTYFF